MPVLQYRGPGVFPDLEGDRVQTAKLVSFHFLKELFSGIGPSRELLVIERLQLL